MENKEEKVELSKKYWSDRYAEGSTGWDMGKISPPLKAYADQLKNKDISILIPGCGKAHEADYLHKAGFTQVWVLDVSEKPLEAFAERVPDFPKEHLICADFFEHSAQYDLILEQTFFCAIDPKLRQKYVEHSAQLLAENGKIAGLLWGVEMNIDQPPFGGNAQEYEQLFSPYFSIETMETAHNSIEKRAGNELFVIFKKK